MVSKKFIVVLYVHIVQVLVFYLRTACMTLKSGAFLLGWANTYFVNFLTCTVVDDQEFEDFVIQGPAS